MTRRSARHHWLQVLIGLAASVTLVGRMVVSPWFHACVMEQPAGAAGGDGHAHHAPAGAEPSPESDHRNTPHDCRCTASQCGPCGMFAHRAAVAADFGGRETAIFRWTAPDLRPVRHPHQLPFATPPPCSA